MARSGEIEIEVSAQWDRWVRGLNNLRDELGDEAMREFEAANDVFYDKTQQYVHVETGNLKASGNREYERDDDTVTALLVYGDEAVDYAIYEEKRGGSHAFITRGWNATYEVFAEALPKAWEAVHQKWRS